MMDRAEAKGFGVAVAGHALLLAALTYSLTRADSVAPPPPPSVEVSFVEEAALRNAAPVPSVEPPAPSIAPDPGPPEEAAPLPEPVPAPPEPAPTPPQPAPPQPAPPRPEPRPQPRQETPAPQRPQPRPQPRAPAPAEAAPQRPAPRAQPSRPAPTAQPPARSGTQTAERPRGSRLGPDLLKGIGSDPSPSRSQAPPAQMTGAAAASIASVIQRQIQPCADRQVYPGPGAERIVTPVSLRLNRDGSLIGRPQVGRQTGLDDENRRYADRVADLAVRSFVECAPLRGLPAELYDVPNGWRNFTMRYRLPE